MSSTGPWLTTDGRTWLFNAETKEFYVAEDMPDERPFFAVMLDGDYFVMDPDGLNDWLGEEELNEEWQDPSAPAMAKVVCRSATKWKPHSGDWLRAPSSYYTTDIWLEIDLESCESMKEVRDAWRKAKETASALNSAGVRPTSDE